ncbi:MAG: hypothetical protein WC841_05830 [Candidatus Shapirobacteria bacterium]|jgi:hypothetical protein
MKKIKGIFSRWSISLITAITIFLAFAATEVNAASFSHASLRYDRIKAETLSSLQVVIVPATVATEDRVVITFGSATVGTTNATSVTNIPTGSVALPGTLSAVSAGTTIVITGVTDLTVGTTYAFNLTIGVSTPAAGTANDIISTRSDATTVIDQTTVASRYITNDQIVINAVVPPSFNFVLSAGNTDTFTANLSGTTEVSTYGNTVTVTTNAPRGWIAWVKSANQGLVSLSTGITIATTGTVNGSPDTLTAGANGYVLDADLTSDNGTGTGTVTIAPEYNGASAKAGGTLSAIFQPFASCNGTTAGDVITLIERATVTTILAAASDYSDTLTVVGAGTF